MKRLFQIEFSKQKANTQFLVFASLWLALFVFVSLIGSQINMSMPGINGNIFYQFPEVWKSISWLASWFNILLGILIIAITTQEFSQKTFRMQLLAGLSRRDLFISKLIVIATLAIVCSIVVFLCSLIFGIIETEIIKTSQVFENIYLLSVFFIQSVAYMCMAFLIAILIRNPALAIISFILYFFPVEPILRLMTPDSVDQFFPIKVISNLTPLPSFISVGGSAQMTTYVNGVPTQMEPPPPPIELHTAEASLVTVFYIAAFVAIAYWVFRKKDF